MLFYSTILTDINEINFFDKNKRTLLMYSCLINDEKIFDILFKKQNFNAQDSLKNNVLHFAVKFYGMKEII